MLVTFQFPRSPFFSGDRSQQVHLTKQVNCEGQFQCLSASGKENLHQPMLHLSLAVPTLRFSTALELKLFLLRHLQKAMNIFSSQDRSLKVELFEMQNQSKSFTHHHPISIVSCRRVDGGGSRFLESRGCSACPGFATWFSRDAMKLSWES